MEREHDMRTLADFIGEALTKTVDPPAYPSLLKSLTVIIRKLLEKDMAQLVNLLYEIDIEEQKLSDLLQQHKSEDVAEVIAAFIIERQQAKVNSRQQNKSDTEIEEDEKW